MRGQGNLELALETRKKERKKERKKKRKKETKKEERLTNGHFLEHLVLAYTIKLMDDLGLVR